MKNIGLEEAQAGIKIVGRNVNNLRYTDDITLMMKVKEESEKVSVLGVRLKDWCWSWNSNTLATWCKELTHWKKFRCWERLRAGGEGGDRRWDGLMTSLTQWIWVWETQAVGDGQGGLVCFCSWWCKELDTTEWLNWTELNWYCIGVFLSDLLHFV